MTLRERGPRPGTDSRMDGCNSTIPPATQARPDGGCLVGNRSILMGEVRFAISNQSSVIRSRCQLVDDRAANCSRRSATGECALSGTTRSTTRDAHGLTRELLQGEHRGENIEI
jgi:hypothetical protein